MLFSVELDLTGTFLSFCAVSQLKCDWHTSAQKPVPFTPLLMDREMLPLHRALLLTSLGVDDAEPSPQDQQAASGLNSRLRCVSSLSCLRRRPPRPHHQETLDPQAHLQEEQKIQRN